METHFGHLFRILHWCTDQSMTNALEKMELTAAQGHIMGYLAHRKDPPCPRDIEEEFQLSHPTVSGLLTRLEKKEFIRFLPDEKDRRCKRIHVLPRGRECMDNMHRIISEHEARLVLDFTPQEQEQFRQYLNRAIANITPGPCKKQPCKEENDT